MRRHVDADGLTGVSDTTVLTARLHDMHAEQCERSCSHRRESAAMVVLAAVPTLTRVEIAGALTDETMRGAGGSSRDAGTMVFSEPVPAGDLIAASRVLYG